MAAGEVTGATEEELEERREAFYSGEYTMHAEWGMDFEDVYCVSKIRRQPEDYDGPQRYCTNPAERMNPDAPRTKKPRYAPTCRNHGGVGGVENGRKTIEQNRDKYANMKHGYWASQESILDTLTEDEKRMYEEIMEWAEVYGFPPREEDPATWEVLQDLAIERIRTLRMHEYVSDEGEVQMREVYDNQGVVVGDYDVENTLTEPQQKQRKLLMSLQKELGLTPKERNRMNKNESQRNHAEILTEIARDALSGDEHEYDPDEFDRNVECRSCGCLYSESELEDHDCPEDGGDDS